MHKRVITYLVSGDDNIKPADENIRRSGRPVKYDSEVNAEAHRALRSGRTYVVVAHGNSNGTISWFASGRDTSERWLWVNMPNAPTGARVYLYACMAGPRLVRYLRSCEVNGHTGTVPMPTGGARRTVLRYFDEVDRLLRDVDLTPAERRKRLVAYLESAHEAEIESPTCLLGSATLLELRDSF